MNRHDALMRSRFGLNPPDSVVNPQTAIFTWHPLIFQDQFDVYDVGLNAEYLENGEERRWSEMFEHCVPRWGNCPQSSGSSV